MPTPPSNQEMAAIMAAMDALWPRPTVEDEVQHQAQAAWKFANRWWQTSAVAQRNRPSRPSSFS